MLKKPPPIRIWCKQSKKITKNKKKTAATTLLASYLLCVECDTGTLTLPTLCRFVGCLKLCVVLCSVLCASTPHAWPMYRLPSNVSCCCCSGCLNCCCCGVGYCRSTVIFVACYFVQEKLIFHQYLSSAFCWRMFYSDSPSCYEWIFLPFRYSVESLLVGRFRRVESRFDLSSFLFLLFFPFFFWLSVCPFKTWIFLFFVDNFDSMKLLWKDNRNIKEKQVDCRSPAENVLTSFLSISIF